MSKQAFYLILVAAISLTQIGFGIKGIREKGVGLNAKEFRRADVILSVGQLGCGIVGLLGLAIFLCR